MAKRRAAPKRWVRVRVLTAQEKRDIAARCERFIAEFLRPRFLPEIRVTEFNYPIDIVGRWRAHRYSFILRYRSDFPDNAGEEFDAPFTRLDHVEEEIAEIRFDVLWRRHTGQWWPSARAVPLEEALHLIETEPFLQPHT